MNAAIAKFNSITGNPEDLATILTLIKEGSERGERELDVPRDVFHSPFNPDSACNALRKLGYSVEMLRNPDTGMPHTFIVRW